MPKFIQSEQSVVVKNHGAFVVNNIGAQGHKDLLVGVIGLGPVFPPPQGAERFEWGTNLGWDTGKVVHRSIFGQTNYGNGAYALIELLPDNYMVFNIISGPYRIKYNK